MSCLLVAKMELSSYGTLESTAKSAHLKYKNQSYRHIDVNTIKQVTAYHMDEDLLLQEEQME